jgi:uncharacterized protein (TIGR03086 family)
MSTQPLEAVVATTRGVLANVTADQMQNSSPCASWDVAGIINHVIGAQGFFVAGMTGTPPSGEEVDYAAGDFLAAYDEATQASIDCFGAEGALDSTVKMPFGEMPGRAVLGLAMTDTFTHGWDLAKATGQSTDLAPELAAQLLAASHQMIQPAFRGDEGAAPFGAEQPCPDGACNADQLAAFLGRDVA